MPKPLEGIRVVKIATYVAAPAAGTLLVDFGADVIKVEVPRGEIVRHTKPRWNGMLATQTAPPLGAHSREILRAAGLREEEVEDALHFESERIKPKG